MAIAGTNIKLDSMEGMDKITQTEKVTTPYFSDGKTELAAANIVSSSQTGQANNEKYFVGIAHKDTPTVQEFDVTFGSSNGFGSLKEANTIAETKAVYGQYASLLLAPTEVTGGFKIAGPATGGSLAAGKRDDEIFVMSARRSNMKDRINKGTWTIQLSGSNGLSLAGKTIGAPILHLTDDSSLGKPTASPVGDRYNIISGTAGTISGSGATFKNYGFFYPDMGILVFSANELSASIPGVSGSVGLGYLNETVTFDNPLHKGFGFSKAITSNSKQALRFINCLQPTGAKLTFRDEEDQVSAQYFCRVRSAQMNFSNNPTFVSGSLNKIRNAKMKGNPQTFITGVQLYNNAGDMVATANLSKPLKKNFTSENTVKVKLKF